MIIRIEDIKKVCSIILNAVDADNLSIVTETIELNAENGLLQMSVTNREYYVTVSIPVGKEDTLHATVNAITFLKLVSQTTTDTIELICNDRNLTFKGNGTYNIPIIFEEDSILELPKIAINNVVKEFEIDSSILRSIYDYNTTQLGMGAISKPVQKLYYVDENGSITFTSGACVTKFTLKEPVKLLFNTKLVKLFKLFKSSKVKFKLGQDALSDDIIQTKVSFESDNIVVNAILTSDESLISSVPAKAIRGRAFNTYAHSVSLNCAEFLAALDRMMLFKSDGYTCPMTFEFNSDNVKITDIKGSNNEKLYYNAVVMEEPYKCVVDIRDIATIIKNIPAQYITFSFGDGQAVVIASGNVYNVIPEIAMS